MSDSTGGVEFLGSAKLIARLVKIRTGIPEATVRGIRKLTIQMRDYSKTIAPVDTGSLRASIRLQGTAVPKGEFIQMGLTAGGHITNPKSGRKVDYASYVEFGTRRMTARPYFAPAIEKYRGDLVKILKEEIFSE